MLSATIENIHSYDNFKYALDLLSSMQNASVVRRQVQTWW
jgi:hypothetical protein